MIKNFIYKYSKKKLFQNIILKSILDVPITLNDHNGDDVA